MEPIQSNLNDDDGTNKVQKKVKFRERGVVMKGVEYKK